MMRTFASRLKEEFEDNLDYQIVDKSHELVLNFYVNYIISKDSRGGALKKHYIITKKTLIICLCRSRLPNSLRYVEYFYEIQNLLVQYYKSQYNDYEMKLKEMLDNPIIKKYTLSQEIKYLDKELNNTSKVGLVYFINEINDLNYFKVGYTYNLPERLSQLQISNRRKLEVYKYVYCTNSNILENIIHQSLSEFLVMGEWYNIDTNYIDTLIAELNE